MKLFEVSEIELGGGSQNLEDERTSKRRRKAGDDMFDF
jgi:hypothetical protein